jgi:hypothetical protein
MNCIAGAFMYADPAPLAIVVIDMILIILPGNGMIRTKSHAVVTAIANAT